MKNFDEYVHFVVGAKIAGQEIEGCELCNLTKNQWSNIKHITWNWYFVMYRIELPEGWEYVIEDGEIAFREPRIEETFWSKDLIIPFTTNVVMNKKRPIIKKIDNAKEINESENNT